MLTALDYALSAFLAGAILLLVLHMNATLADANAGQVVGVCTQENVADLGSILTTDLSKIGYRVPTGMSPIISADTLGNISFRADLFSNTNWVDSITYRVVSAADGKARRILRSINNGSALALGPNLDSIAIQYYDGKGNQLPASLLASQVGRDSIRSLVVRLGVAIGVPDSYQMAGTTNASGGNGNSVSTNITGYAKFSSSWQRKISPRNLQLAK